MNADIGRIEYIVSMYIELSEKAQEKIDKEIIKLWVKENLDIEQFTGNQKWQIFCLEQFLNLCEQ